MATRKAPRRTAQRILESSLALFNRFGEPGVSTNAIAADMGISPGNLYYHFPAKDDLVNALFLQYEQALQPILDAADAVTNVEDAWFFLHSLFEANWQYRFVFRNLNELLSRNRHLEARVREWMDALGRSMNALLSTMQSHRALLAPPLGWDTVGTSMVVVQVYWLSYEYVRDPRKALEEDNAQNAALRSAAHVLSLLAPYATSGQQAHLRHLIDAYGVRQAEAQANAAA
ncbi:TetR/AcrR family transcriptional regulator [Diaphorobacter ruginosibacter]|jgi:AcrR family transcriptional regulator|uniref:TetR/AcrR family transcriptional regulator n=1 Tax=Diaphorobacter ruginosibacter TaxID=1715720 RepID=A0A7G9RQE7_9BURK|nr:TetR/AcrR family transcriptional regulator [Diaphorobacter ruginosibacter]MDR2333433.1 TetR/AcrR family transcriptional regulator [Burkholderiaceae bacterium]QNN57822.1 TetR/AcrR family transcriptional regulator [Diaphorobacter ruginosibacter]